MKTSRAYKYSPLVEYEHSPAGSGGFGNGKGFSCQAVPEKSLMSFSLLKLSLPSLAAMPENREYSKLPLLGSKLQPDLGPEGVAGVRNSLRWVGISLVLIHPFPVPNHPIPGWDPRRHRGAGAGRALPEQPDFLHGFMANSGTGPDPHPP